MVSCTYLLILFLPAIHAVSIEIDGVINLGTHWNYKFSTSTNKHKNGITTSREPVTDISNSKQIEYRLHNFETNNSSEKIMRVDAITGNLTTNKKKFSTKITSLKTKTTKATDKLNTNGIFEKPHKIKEDIEVNEFMKHIFKQTMAVFETLKNKINDYTVKNKIDFLSRSYEMKFDDFVKETQKQDIKTILGQQKVILNIIDTSSRILKRLVNFLMADMAKKGMLRTRSAATNVFQKEVDSEVKLEYKHACLKFGVCRAEKPFSNFLISFISIILQNENKKLKIAVDALTEITKETDFSRIMDSDTEEKFLNGISYIENSEVEVQRALLAIIKNILSSKNMPIVVDSKNAGGRINKTVAFLKIIDIFEKALPGNDENLLEWNNIKNSMQEWSDGSRKDILEIMKTFVDYLSHAVDGLDSKSTENVKSYMATIIK